MSPEKQRRTFLSYSRINKEFALRLAKELKSSGFQIWIDQLDIPTGARWDDELEKALEISEIFMVILTPASIASDNVKDEIGYAIDNNKRILPILLENAKVPLRLRRFQYVDFTGKSYDEGVEGAKQLLRKLIEEPTIPMEHPAVAVQAQKAENDRPEREKLAVQRTKEESKAREASVPALSAPLPVKSDKAPAAPLPAKAETAAQSVPDTRTSRPPQPVKKKGFSKPLMIGIGIGALSILVLCAVVGASLFIQPDPPAVEEPVFEEPVFEEPAAEEPVAEEPVVEEPGSIPVSGDPACPFDSSQPVEIYVENPSSLNLDYYWVDYDCQTQYYGTLNAGESMTLSTYVTHVWVFFDNQTGDFYYEYAADGGDYLALPGNNSAPALTGSTVTYVSYGDGKFTKVDDIQWVETTADGTEYYFEEFDRDETSVYLYDAGRDIYVNLDISTYEIYLWDSTNETWNFLYSINLAE